MSERLDQIERLIAANAETIAAGAAAMERMRLRVDALTENAERFERNLEASAAETAELRSTVNALVETVELHQRNHEVSQRNFERIMAEIRGMRMESQRILEHLFGTEGNGA